MTPIEQLRKLAAQLAKAKRQQIDLEVRIVSIVLNELERKSRPPVKKRTKFTGRVIRPSKPDSPYCRMTTIQAANHVLREGKPMGDIDLTIEIMSRGHRAKDKPMDVLKCLKASFDYHSDKFFQDAEGRWGIV